MDRIKFFRRLRIFQIVITLLICLIEKSRIYLIYERPITYGFPYDPWYPQYPQYPRYSHPRYDYRVHLAKNYNYITVATISTILLGYNLFRSSSEDFTGQFLRLFNLYDNYLDSILLFVWSITVVTNTIGFFTNLDLECYSSTSNSNLNIFLCWSYIISYILGLLMFVSCIIRMVTKYSKYGENSHQRDDSEYTPLLRGDDVEGGVDTNVKSNEIDTNLTDVDAKEGETDVKEGKSNMKSVEDVKGETSVKLTKHDDSEGK